MKGLGQPVRKRPSPSGHGKYISGELPCATEFTQRHGGVEDESTSHLTDSNRELGKEHHVSAPAGLILLDRYGDCLYINSEAQEVLCFSAGATSKTEIREMIRSQIRSVILPLSRRFGDTGVLTSGRRTYLCRILLLETGCSDSSLACAAVMFQRAARADERILRVCQQYSLTAREREVLAFLMDGLTSKDIAKRMNISVHTVKGFLHLIMVKIGVTTRSAVVGRVNSQ